MSNFKILHELRKNKQKKRYMSYINLSNYTKNLELSGGNASLI